MSTRFSCKLRNICNNPCNKISHLSPHTQNSKLVEIMYEKPKDKHQIALSNYLANPKDIKLLGQNCKKIQS